MGYPQDLLSSRAVIRHGKFALIPPEGLVHNVIPGFENCTLSILASPRLGASFVNYHVTFHENGMNSEGFGGQNDIETFVYVLEGELQVATDYETFKLDESGYLYCPPGTKMYLKNISDSDTKVYLYKQKYRNLKDYEPWVVSGNANEVKAEIYADMENVGLKNLLPEELAFDINFHILIFDPASSHPFVETHVQEHGAYLLSGEGLYNLHNEWIPVKKGDYIWFGSYALQACYAVGREKLAYVYSKDCNRDEEL